MPMGSNFLQADKVAQALISFNTRFNKAMAELSVIDPVWDQFAMPVPSDTQIEQYNWMGMVPGFSEWKDERKISKLRNFSYQVVNRNWANGIEVDMNDLNDDKLGLYGPKIAQLAEQAMFHKVVLLSTVFKDGFTAKGYDNQVFIGAAHQDGDGPTQSNLLANNPALDVTPFQNAYAQMESLKDENGNPANARATHLLVGPSNRAKAEAIVAAQFLASGATNVNYKRTEIIVSPVLVASSLAGGVDLSGYWALLDLKHQEKPFLWQTREPVRFTSVTGLDSPEVFKRRKLMFGADGRYNAAYAMWQYIIGSRGDGNA
jgi:phage major head subunit gpT-like protein